MKRRPSQRSRKPVEIGGLSVAEFMLRGSPPTVDDAQPHRDHYKIVIGAGLWRGFEVSVERPTSTHPLRAFRTPAEAAAYAEELARVEGWLIVDQTGGDQ